MFAPNFTKLQLEDGKELSTGWKPRYLDRRDYREDSPKVKPILDKMKLGVRVGEPLATQVDRSEFFPPIKDQLDIGSCTAHAASYIMEYYQKRAFGVCVPSSRLFIYKATRNLQRETGDVGAYLRTTMAALALLGSPPESYYPYKTPDFDKEPNQFLYSLADNYEANCYFCLDPMDAKESGDVIIDRIKKYISAGIPSMFGFYIFPSWKSGRRSGESSGNVGYIPFPGDTEDLLGGHAVAIAGYDDELVIMNDLAGGASVGAFKFINSWGTEWGFNGYGWLPYDYVRAGIANDFWAILSTKFIDTGKFGLMEV